jgi:hypothetical protein
VCKNKCAGVSLLLRLWHTCPPEQARILKHHGSKPACLSGLCEKSGVFGRATYMSKGIGYHTLRCCSWLTPPSLCDRIQPCAARRPALPTSGFRGSERKSWLLVWILSSVFDNHHDNIITIVWSRLAPIVLCMHFRAQVQNGTPLDVGSGKQDNQLG